MLNEAPDMNGHFEQAARLRQMGYRLVALKPRTKRPEFAGWQTAEYGEEELHRLFEGSELGVGIVCGGDLVVLDIDSTDAGDLEWVLEHVGETPMKVRSPRGGLHLYFRTRAGVQYGNGVKLRGKPFDLRWNGTFIVSPWSIGENGKPYEWVGDVLPARELPLMRVGDLRDRKRPQKIEVSPGKVIARTVHAVRNVTNPEAYALRIMSIQGQGGSRGLVRAVAVLRDCGRSPQQAFDFLSGRWNRVCAKPEWSEAELMYAIRRHYGLR